MKKTINAWIDIKYGDHFYTSDDLNDFQLCIYEAKKGHKTRRKCQITYEYTTKDIKEAQKLDDLIQAEESS